MHADAFADAAGLLDSLRLRHVSLGTAESLTGGGLGALITSVPGASEVYAGGLVTYATRLKIDLLGVDRELVAEHGVVSAPCATAMAVGARAALGVDVALSTTGVAGPEPQEGRPVGLVFLGLSGPGGTEAVEVRLPGDRAAVRQAAAWQAVRALVERLDRITGIA